MIFQEKYTTATLKSADALKDVKDQTEQKKLVVSEEAFLNAEMISQLISKIENVRISLIK